MTTTFRPDETGPAMDETFKQVWQQATIDFDARRLDQAIIGCEKLLTLDPRYPMAHAMLSSIHLLKGRYRLANSHAIEASMGSAGLPAAQILAISSALISAGESEEASRILKTIDIEASANLPWLVKLGQSFSNLEDQTSALRCLEKARHAGIQDKPAHLALGKVLSFIGSTEQAVAAFETVIELEETNGSAHWSLSLLGLKDGGAKRIARMEALRKRPDVTTDEAVYLNFALFREFDLADHTHEAWQALERACSARRSQTIFDARQQTAVYDQIIRTTAPGFLGKPGETSAESTPIFIVGMPRTGTTILERILGNHPQVTACGELKAFKAQVQWVSDRTLPAEVGLRFGEVIEKLDYPLLGRRYLEKTRWRTDGKPFFIDKHPMNFLLAGLIMKALPQARILNVQRNPMDSCFSNFKELFGKQFYPYSYQLDELAQHYRNHRRLTEHWHHLAPNRMLDVRYEDLVREPEEQARRVLAYCGLSQAPNLVDIQTNEKVTTTMSTQQVRQPIHQGYVGGWKRYQQQLEPLRAQLEDLIAANEAALTISTPA